MGSLRVVVVDDNPIMLVSARRLLSSIANVDIVAEATSGLEALQAAERLRPDLVLMDLAMPEMDGLEATRRLRTTAEPPIVLIMTGNDFPEYREAARVAGARDLLGKADLSERLRFVIEQVRSERAASTGRT